jgi:hypothetical protein
MSKIKGATEKNYERAVKNVIRIEELHIIIGNNPGFQNSHALLKEYTDLMGWFECMIYHDERFLVKEPMGYQMN